MRRDDSEKSGLPNSSSAVALKGRKPGRSKSSTLHCFNGFALYEVILGVAIFAVGVLALWRAVENCLNGSMLNSEEEAVRQISSHRTAEVQPRPGFPDR